jgi:Ras-related protein Rab-1A
VSTSLLKTALTNYLKEIEGVLAVAVCDRNGLIIASEGREETGSENVIGVISTILDGYIERIKSEFGTESNFFNITTTGDKKFAYCSMGPHSILTSIASPDTSDVKLRVFSEHIAGKIELILEDYEEISLEIPEIIRVLSKTRGGKLPEGEYSNKLILTGDYQVGKSSLISRFIENTFSESYISTLGVEISKKTMEVSDETKVNFIIWDIAGQRKTVKPNFYTGANAAFMVVDRTRKETLENINTWYDEIKSTVKAKIPIVLVGNKTDMIDSLVISEEEIKEFAQKKGFHYILTSAKTGENVNDAFLYIAYKVMETV